MSAPAPVRRALTTFAAVVAVTLGGGLALGSALPGLSGRQRAFLVLLVLTGAVLTSARRFGTWRDLGVCGPRRWMDSHLLVVPALLSITPLVLGVRVPAPGLLPLLVVGYALTGLTEELLWRGIVQRVLAPLGSTRAVLLTAALFGLAHLPNVVFRGSAALVLAQAWGAFCFGVGYGALRERTGTLVPLIALHATTDLAAAIGAVPAIPVLVAQDVVLLTLGLVLLHQRQDRLDHLAEPARPAPRTP